jgi:hypothetical protein
MAALLPTVVRRLRTLTGLGLRGTLLHGRVDLAAVDIPALARRVIEIYAANLPPASLRLAFAGRRAPVLASPNYRARARHGRRGNRGGSE